MLCAHLNLLIKQSSIIVFHLRDHVSLFQKTPEVYLLFLGAWSSCAKAVLMALLPRLITYSCKLNKVDKVLRNRQLK